MAKTFSAVVYHIGTEEQREAYKIGLAEHAAKGHQIVSTVALEQTPQEGGTILTTSILVTYSDEGDWTEEEFGNQGEEPLKPFRIRTVPT